MRKNKILRLPPHANPTSDERIACAPYNFVPLPKTVVTAVDSAENLPGHDTYANPGYPHTGFFEVTLTTKSPLFIRGPLTQGEFEFDEVGLDRNGDETTDSTLVVNRIKNKPFFFHTSAWDQPIIPGSSLRGMLRALLEVASYGKVEKVDNKRLIHRAVADGTALGNWYREQMLGPNQTPFPNMKFDYPSPWLRGGYLCKENGRWAIRPAKQHDGNGFVTSGGETFVHVEYNRARPVIGSQGEQQWHKVFVTPVARTSPSRGQRPVGGDYGELTLNLALTSQILLRTSGQLPPTGMVRAALVESGHMGKPYGQEPNPHQKHMHCAIYEEDSSVEPIEIPESMWWAYEQDRDMTRGRKTRTRELNTIGQPLFYLVDASNKLVFFGPTMMFRLPYERSAYDLIRQELRNPLDVDYADALFGFLRGRKDFPQAQSPLQGEKRRGYSSRVFVTDATPTREFLPNDLWYAENAITPPILSSPKPTSFQHYLVQPEMRRDDLSHYDSPKQDARGDWYGFETVIRGHKIYWHQGNVQIENQSTEQDTSKQHTRVRPVQSGVTFKFFVHFENLSDEELGALCWTLHPLGSDDVMNDPAKGYCHSLGMGKPFGMGAVKLDATLHLTRRDERYRWLFSCDRWNTGVSGGGEKLVDGTDRSRLEARVLPFETKILEALALDKTCDHLSDLKRVGILLKMMEWPGFPAETPAKLGNRVLTSGGKPNTRYMTVQLEGVHPRDKNEYKNRPVLPDPSAENLFGPLTGDAEPVSEEPDQSTDNRATVESTGAGRSVAPGRDFSSAKRSRGTDRQETSPTGAQNISQWTKPTNVKPQKPKITEAKEKVTLLAEPASGRAKVRSSDGHEIEARFSESLRVEVGRRYHAQVKRQDGKIITAEVRALV